MSSCPPGVVSRASQLDVPELEALGLPGGGYMSGAWMTQNLDLPVIDPEDGSLIAHVRSCSGEEVLTALESLSSHLRNHVWPLWERREVLERAAKLVLADVDNLARIISAEGSKTLTEAEREVRRSAETLRLSANATYLLEGQTLALADTPRGEGKLGWNRREAVGIVAAITPFNDPLNLVAHKVGPALIAGNAVMLKPSEMTPLSALAMMDILLRAGMPEGRMAVLVADREAVRTLVSDPRVGAVSFTGGPRTGDLIAQTAGARKLQMELGGNNAVLVCEDADVQAAAARIVDGAFGVAGQSCLSVQRVYVHSSRYEQLLEIIVRDVQQLVVGSKRDRSTDIGPLISEEEAQRVERWVCEAVQAGAQIMAGGHRAGPFHDPTVLTGVPEHAKVLREEMFGPVVSVLPFSDIEEAVNRANSTDYGLHAGVFTHSMDTALYAADKLHVGTVLINESSDFRIDSMPFGGPKRSGVGREGVASAVLELSELKNVIISNLG